MDMILFRGNERVLNDKLQTLRDIMEQLKIKAKDIRDEVQNEELQAGKRKKGQVKLWLEEVSKIEEEVDSIRTEVEQASVFNSKKLLNDLEGMIRRVQELLKQGDFPRGIVLPDLKTEGILLLAGQLVGDIPSEVQKEIWSCFERGEFRVGIYGMGGVGKTSVAMCVNNKILTKRDVFNHVYYVTVSRETSVYKLQSDIAKALEYRLVNEDELKRAAELNMALKKREKPLLILDDVWEYISMEKVGVAIEGDGCKLLITTRNKDVCRQLKCKMIEMKPLSEYEAWVLFVEHLGNYEALSDEVKHTARLVAKECAGLPLGIITMARCMGGICDESEWRTTLRKLQNPSKSQHDMENQVFYVLQLSYDRLDNIKKKCLLVCASYPEDFLIDPDELIRYFLAEGLVDGSSGQEMIEEGRSLLIALERASLLEFAIDRSKRTWVKMHDLVRDMAINIMRVNGIGMVKAGKGLKEVPENVNWTQEFERVSLMKNDIQDIDEEISPECPKLSILILQNNPLKSISSSFFMHMVGLKFLDLSRTNIRALPLSVSDLCNLNALWLSWCSSLESIPSMAKLKKLRELNLDYCPSIIELPCGIEELVNCRRLDLDGASIRSIPDGLLSKLRKLESFWSQCAITTNVVEELMELKYFDRFKAWTDDLKMFNQCVRSGFIERLQNYSLCVSPGEKLVSFRFDRHVQFYESKIGSEPPLLVPCNVQHLRFARCSFGVSSLVDVLSTIHDARSELKHCELADCVGIKSILSDRWLEQGRGEDRFFMSFEGVRELVLKRLHDFICLVEGDVVRPSIFRCVRQLIISRCPKLKKLGLLGQELHNLEEVDIEYCEQMEELFVVANDVGDDAILLPNLRKLRLFDLPELRSIWSSFFPPKLITLYVWGCPKLKKLGLLGQELHNLEEVDIEYCEQMEELFAMADDVGDDAIPMPNLRRLGLKNLSELRSIGRSSFFPPKLIKLSVEDCPKFKRLALVQNQELHSLEKIFIEECEQMEEIFATANEAGYDAIQLPNLRSLELCNLPELKSICGNSFFPPKLITLYVWGCPKLKRLALVLNQELHSLEHILIAQCKQMEEIFATADETGYDAIQLPNLRSLALCNLPELKSICRKTIVCNHQPYVQFLGETDKKLKKCLILSSDTVIEE